MAMFSSVMLQLDDFPPEIIEKIVSYLPRFFSYMFLLKLMRSNKIIAIANYLEVGKHADATPTPHEMTKQRFISPCSRIEG